jgi:hypothetical protein
MFADQTLKVTPREEILYTSDVTAAEAGGLGKVLQEERLFDGNGDKSVRLSKRGDVYVVSFVLRFGYDRPGFDEEFRGLGRRISEKALGGRPVEVEIRDQWGELKKTLR